MKNHHQSSGKGRRLEYELILCCVQAFVNGNLDELKRFPFKEIEWTYLLRIAKDHKVLPLIYWSIKSACLKSLPADIMAQLNADFNNNAVNNLTLIRELFRLLDIFRSNSIPAIPFKGPILASSVYGNIALRQFWDLDILVHPEDFIKAKDLLLSEGYMPWLNLSEEKYEALAKHDRVDHHCRFSKRNPKIHIELHWSMYPRNYPSRLETQSLFERAEPLVVSGHEILSFSPEDMLLFLCHHGTKHRWIRISWICDIAMLLKNRAINWPYVIEFARNAGIERCLNLGIILASDLLETPLQENILQKAQRDSAAVSLSQQIKANMFLEDDAGFLQTSLFQFRTLQRTDDRLRYFSNFIKTIVLPNELDRKYIGLPESVFFAYFLIRPIRLLRVYVFGPSRSLVWSRGK